MVCQLGVIDIITAHHAALLPIVPQLILPMKRALESGDDEVSELI